MTYLKPGRISVMPVKIPDALDVNWSEETRELIIKNKTNSFALVLEESISITVEQGELSVHAKKGYDNSKALSGTYRSIIDNAVSGLVKDWEKKLLFEGVGYKVMPGSSKNSIALHVGYSNPIEYFLSENVSFEIADNNRTLILKSYDKQVLGQVAAEIRSKRLPNRYSGKGIRYYNEVIDLKEVGK